jgi:aromatic ring-opening dioxygenase catalytic subunit (LigB family)
MHIPLSSILVALLIACMSYFYKLYNTIAKPTLEKSVHHVKRFTMPEADHFVFNKSDKPLPVFFFSHGGPTFADKNDKLGSNLGAWNTTNKIGNYIKNKLKPDFIIVVSAHWQTNNPDEIEVSIPGEGEAWYTQNDIVSKKIRPDENALIYDFYGFPKKFYDSQFHTISNNFIANDIVKTLKESDWFQAKVQQRGIDHGAFVPMKVAFGNTEVLDSGKLDVDVPVIQVSLAGTSDIAIHYKLGEILSKYRDLNGTIIFSGMSVHNLRDLGKAMANNNKPLEYVKPFNKILTDILTNPDKEQVFNQLKQLPNNPEWAKHYKGAHPTNEHLLPAIVAAGAARGDECKLLYDGASGSLGWNLYRWGTTGETDL